MREYMLIRLYPSPIQGKSDHNSDHNSGFMLFVSIYLYCENPYVSGTLLASICLYFLRCTDSSPVSRTKSRTLKAFGFSIVRHICRTIASDIADKCSYFWHHFHLKIRRETQRRHEGDTKFAPDRANGFCSKI